MKEERINRTKWLHIRLSEDEHKKINNKFGKTTCRKLSDYSRRVLLDKKVTTLTRNQSLDDFMAEMIRLRNELSAIGNNWNQAVKRLHTLDHFHEMKIWIISTQKLQQSMVDKTLEIRNKIGKISEQWLQ